MKSFSIFDGLFLLLLMFRLGDFGYKPSIWLLFLPHMLAAVWMIVALILKATGYKDLPAYAVWKYSLKVQTAAKARKVKREIMQAAMGKIKKDGI